MSLTVREHLQQAPIVVTTYGMIAANRKKGSPLWSILWNRIVFDEAHHMRNMKTSTFKGASKLKSNTKWLVTGTPIQNRKTDFYALCAILGLKTALYANPAAIPKIISHHLLRRTKASVGIRLPPLNTQTIVVPWASPEEKHLAAQIHSMASFSRVTLENVDDIIRELTTHPLPMLTRARQVCVFPHLLHTAVKKLQREGKLPAHLKLAKVKTYSKAMSIVRQLIARRDNRRRKIVFCHYRGEIDMIKALLQRARISVSTVDGRSGKKKRKISFDYVLNISQFSAVCKTWNRHKYLYRFINEFMAPQVIVVQIQTASEGLNLQHCQEVYFTSPHWNPAVEDQAIARSHRIGQHDRVDVFRFIMADFNSDIQDPSIMVPAPQITLDKYCQTVQERKRELMKFIDPK